MAFQFRNRIDFPDQMREVKFSTKEMGWNTFESLRGFFVFIFIVYSGLMSWMIWVVSKGMTTEILFSPLFLLMVMPTVLSVTLLMIALAVIVFLASWRQAVKQRAVQLTCRYGYTETALYVQTPMTDSRIEWVFFAFARETKRAFFLYDASKPYIIPKRIFTDAENAQIRSCIRNHIPQRRRLFSRKDKQA